MSLLDINNLDALSPEQKAQFEGLLTQYPHLDPKADRELNTPTKLQADELDYSSFLPDKDPPRAVVAPVKHEIPKLAVNPKDSFLQEVGREEKEREEQQKREKEQIRPMTNGVSFNPTGKVHPILQKMRATVGLSLAASALPKIELAGCIYTLRQLDRAGLVGALSLASSSSLIDQNLYSSNLEVAILAYAIVEIDNVPAEIIFEAPERIDDRLQSPEDRHTFSATHLFVELLHSKNELIDALSTFYQQEFPNVNVLASASTKFICPEADCLQSRIAEVDSGWYCPIHGQKMVKEVDLPNPS